MNEKGSAEPKVNESTESVSPVEEPKPVGGTPSKPAAQDDLDKVREDLAEAEKKMTGFEKSTLRWTRASFVVIFFTGLFIALQWHEMRVGGKDTHILAEAAKQSADTQEHSLQMETRRAEDQEEAVCRLRSDGMAALDHIEHIRVINSGKVKVRNIVSHADVSLNDALTLRKIRDLGSVDISTSELDGGSQSSSSVDRELNLPLTNGDWQNLADTNQVIINRGHIRYENGFGRVVDEPYCDGWWYFRSPGDKLNPIQGRGTECGQIPVNVSGIRKPKAK